MSISQSNGKGYSSGYTQSMNIFHPFRLAPLTGRGPKTDKEIREFSPIFFP
jgi:hypothetical protein